MDREQAIIWASGFYLAVALPQESKDWDEDLTDSFILEHAWEPFEHYECDELWELITSLADSALINFGTTS